MGGFLFSGITYAATLNFASGDVQHTKSDGSKTTVSAAINELYSKSITPSKVIGNAYTGGTEYLNGSSALTTYTELNLANYRSSNQYAFKLGGKEQLTLPAGYYNLPVNIATAGGTSDASITVSVIAKWRVEGSHDYGAEEIPARVDVNINGQTYSFNPYYKKEGAHQGDVDFAVVSGSDTRVIHLQ